MSREHTTMFGCLTFHLHGAERINKLGVDVYLYTSLRSAALPIINMERSGAGNGERRNVQGTYNNVQLPYLSFTERNGEIGRFSWLLPPSSITWSRLIKAVLSLTALQLNFTTIPPNTSPGWFRYSTVECIALLSILVTLLWNADNYRLNGL
jgi:hypothetical protein